MWRPPLNGWTDETRRMGVDGIHDGAHTNPFLPTRCMPPGTMRSVLPGGSSAVRGEAEGKDVVTWLFVIIHGVLRHPCAFFGRNQQVLG